MFLVGFYGVFTMAISFIFIITVIMRAMISSVRRTNIHDEFKKNVINTFQTSADGEVKFRHKDIKKEKLATFNTDNLEGLKDMFYNQFLQFEKAYNNLDYHTMRIVSTKQLYYNYYTGITLDLRAGDKRIIDDIERKNMIIYDLYSTQQKQEVFTEIEIEYINYVIDKKGNIKSGSRTEKIRERFEVVFRKDFEEENVRICPSCGARVVGNKCDYCRTIIDDVDFKISSIKKIVEQLYD